MRNADTVIPASLLASQNPPPPGWPHRSKMMLPRQRLPRKCGTVAPICREIASLLER
jgi:hypothetical protein